MPPIVLELGEVCGVGMVTSCEPGLTATGLEVLTMCSKCAHQHPGQRWVQSVVEYMSCVVDAWTTERVFLKDYRHVSSYIHTYIHYTHT